MKGCVNDVSECRYNCRRNGLKEMIWNRIKRTSSRMTGKDAFRDFCLRGFSYFAARSWNQLPEEIRCAKTLATFKSRLKTHLFSCAFVE